MSVTEKRDAPLLIVARVLPSTDRARPKGLGASIFPSAPTGVRSRPLGKTAPLYPSMLISLRVGKSPAGALKKTVSDFPERGWSRSGPEKSSGPAMLVVVINDSTTAARQTARAALTNC